MTDNSRGRSLTASENEALKILYGLRVMGLVPRQTHNYIKMGEIKLVARELLNEGTFREIKERRVEFAWHDQARVIIILSKGAFYNPDKEKPKNTDDEPGDWWDAKTVELKIRDRYGNEGEIKFVDLAAVNVIWQAYNNHGSLVYYNG